MKAETTEQATDSAGNSNQHVSSESSCKDWLFIGKPQWSKNETLIPPTSQQNLLQTKFPLPIHVYHWFGQDSETQPQGHFILAA